MYNYEQLILIGPSKYQFEFNFMSKYYWTRLEIIMWIYTQNKFSYLNINNPEDKATGC